MEAYSSTLENIGDKIISWADPDGQFGGYTKVRL